MSLSQLGGDQPGAGGWLTPVILATQETEMGKIDVPGKPKQNTFQDPILVEKSLVWCVPVIPVLVVSIIKPG
jgi:hypothetical protein